MKKIFSLLLILTAFVVSISAKDVTTVFTVNPQMSCQNCENKIKSNLRFEKGVKNIETSLSAQTVSVTYNPEKTNVETLQKGFAKIGYNASVAKDKNAATDNGAKCSDSTCDKATKSCCNTEKKDCKKAENKDCKKSEKKCCKNTDCKKEGNKK